MNQWLVGVIGSVIGFLVAQSIAFYTFAKNVEITKKIEMVHLGRDLVDDFYGDNDGVFKDVRLAIESCRFLYKGFDKDKGLFGRDDLNRYLGFFDDLGFYNQIEVINLEFVNQFFGAYIIEAYEFPELQRYVKEVQENAKQRSAFADFQKLAQSLEQLPERRDLVEEARKGCTQR